MAALRRAALALAAALAAGHAGAQDAGALCRSFCDADAKTCRAEAKDRAEVEVSPLDPNDFNVHAHPQPPRDDFSDEKKRTAVQAADKDRFTASQKCTAAKMQCVQHCGAPTAPPAASAP